MAQVKALKRSNDDLKKQRKTFETELESLKAKLKSLLSPKTKNKNMAHGISRHICKSNFVIYIYILLSICILFYLPASTSYCYLRVDTFPFLLHNII